MDIYVLILIAVLLVSVILLFVLLIKQQKRTEALIKEVAAAGKKVEVTRHDVSSLCASALGVDERVSEAERRLRNLVARLSELEESDTFENLQEFQTAIELAKDGVSAEGIVEQSHLTLDEAGLLIRLHKN